ncbi:uncharacterized protein LOC144109976 [Amblyomma americanum]
MTRLARFALAVTLAVICVIRSACCAKLPEAASTVRSTESRSKLAASNGLMEIWDDAFEIKNEQVVTDEATVLAGWLIAVIVIVPLLGVVCIIALCVCICRACAKPQVTTTYVIQGGPPPYPGNGGGEMEYPK